MSVLTGVLASVLTAGTLILLASPLIYRGFQHRARYHRFQELPVETPATASPGTSAFITGIAHSRGESTIEAPVSGNSVLLAAWDIHSLRRYHPLGVRHVWAPEALGIDSTEFTIEEGEQQLFVPDWSRQDRIEGKERLKLSGTGQMPVEGLDVEGLWVERESFDTNRRIRPDEEVPDRLQALSSRLGVPIERPTRWLPTLPWLRTPEGTLKYREASIQDGDEMTILGDVTESRLNNESRQIVEPDDVPPLISPLNPDLLLQRYKWSYLKSMYGIGIVILIVALTIGIGVAL